MVSIYVRIGMDWGNPGHIHISSLGFKVGGSNSTFSLHVLEAA